MAVGDGGKEDPTASMLGYSHRTKWRSSRVNHIMQFVREEEGATALEYGLLAALVAAALVGTVTMLGATVSQIFADMNSAISVGAGS